jgi:ELWxxDGT repeat protein
MVLPAIHQRWRTEGTRRGHEPPQECRPDQPSGLRPGDCIVTPETPDTSGALFFVADDGVHGSDLWRMDGTPTGTRMVADGNPGSERSEPYDITAYAHQVAFLT